MSRHLDKGRQPKMGSEGILHTQGPNDGGRVFFEEPSMRGEWGEYLDVNK